ncbi:hypothetical protein [Luteimonas sp. 100069]|uniref:hypothetical protein n=1 Tax=Luteimonas sp. 100069 TaxID=2006109 RepID=UPI000F50639A|nr:hypothetical protein [Luteimonas sp. 100069]RPD88471.1 hypothetical protein EGK76_04785 [Luteimonas sp. 100069]
MGRIKKLSRPARPRSKKAIQEEHDESLPTAERTNCCVALGLRGGYLFHLVEIRHPALRAMRDDAR